MPLKIEKQRIFFSVKDVLGLRIVDASVFPAPISGNPNSVIIAMAERAADFISSDKKWYKLIL